MLIVVVYYLSSKFAIFKVEGDSMSPLLYTGDLILVKINDKTEGCRLSYEDVVVVKFYDKLLVKSVFGIHNTLFKLNEDSLTNSSSGKSITTDTWKLKYIDTTGHNFKLPPDYFLVYGLNANYSFDSSKTGPFHCRELVGTYILRFF
jgi:signal peptidase I